MTMPGLLCLRRASPCGADRATLAHTSKHLDHQKRGKGTGLGLANGVGNRQTKSRIAGLGTSIGLTGQDRVETFNGVKTRRGNGRGRELDFER